MIPLRDDNPTRSFPILTIVLIVVNVIVFLRQDLFGDSFFRSICTFGMVPAEVTHGGPSPCSGVNYEPHWVTLFTSMFLHGGWGHLLGNMLYLWVFGNNVEDTLGKIQFLVFYLVCGAAAGLTHLVLNANSTAPTVGASGAIAGVLGGYILLFPGARVLTLIPLFFIFIREIPASIVLGFWFLVQLLNAVTGSGMIPGHSGGHAGGVAVWAHVGGFVAGFVLVRLFGGQRREPPIRRPSFMDY